jgi:hypothetical protein
VTREDLIARFQGVIDDELAVDSVLPVIVTFVTEWLDTLGDRRWISEPADMAYWWREEME